MLTPGLDSTLIQSSTAQKSPFHFFRCVFSPQTTSIQPRSRRTSSQAAANTSTSAVDDFDKLIMEFTDDDDMLDDGVDNDVNEDDLLQELSEMIEIDG